MTERAKRSFTEHPPNWTMQNRAEYDTPFTRSAPSREYVEAEFAARKAAGSLCRSRTTRPVRPAVHEGVPGAVPAADDETGRRTAPATLARLLEPGESGTG